MDNLSYATQLQHHETSIIDDDAIVATGRRTRRVTSTSPVTFGIQHVLDGLSPYVAVFGCTGNCPG